MQIISIEILSPGSLKLLRELEEWHMIRLITRSVNKASKRKWLLSFGRYLERQRYKRRGSSR